MKVIGLTGSIAMGKSTTAQMFAQENVPVFDADAEVHALYARGGEAVDPISALAPDAIIDGSVDRAALSKLIGEDQSLLGRIEAVVHPLVAQKRAAFLAEAKKNGAACVLLDIPLLLESKSTPSVDVIVVVTAPPEMQRARALARPGMSEEKFNAILARQMPDAEKRQRADYVIDTGSGLVSAQNQVRAVLAHINEAPHA